MIVFRSRWYLLILAAVEVAISSSVVVPLTKENFEHTTRGKNVFIKWFDPKCEHCKMIAPEWEKLAYWNTKENSLVMIAEVDCRASHQQEKWCFNEMEIFGVPSLLYGEPSHGGEYLRSYGDGKTFVEMDRFVNETLSEKLFCSPGAPENCDDDTQQMIRQFWTMSAVELQKEIDRVEDKMDAVRRTFKDGKDHLQSIYDDASLTHQQWVASLKRNIKLLYSVQHARQKQ